MRPASAPAGDQPRAPRALPGAVAGMLAAAVAIGAAQLVAGLTAPASSPVLAVGQAAIDLTPLPVKDFAISAFGTADKTVLLGGILVVLALYAAVVGIVAVRRLAFGMWGLGLFAFIGLWAALTRPGSTADVPLAHPGRRGGRGVHAGQAGRRGGTAERAPVPGPAPAPAGAVPGAGARVPPAPETLTPPDLPAPPAAASDPGAAEPSSRESGASPPGYSFTFLPNPGRPGAAPRARTAAVPGRQRDSRGRRGGRHGRRTRAGHPARRHPGAGRAAFPPAGGGGAAAARRQRPAHSRPQLVRHAERQLLPGRHRARPAPGRPVELAAADPRHGEARGHAHLRRAAQAAADRGLRHARAACPTRSAARTSATRSGSAPAWPTCSGRPARRPAPTSCCAPRSTGSPRAPRCRSCWTAGTRCSRWR